MNKTVLLIDDDPDEAELFRDVLYDIDPSISYHHFLSGITAVSNVAGRRVSPDIIFLDINMPEINGWECLRALKAIPEARDIPIYMYSTSRRENDRVVARSMGAVELVTKAYDYREFKETVAAILLGRAKYLSGTNPIALCTLFIRILSAKFFKSKVFESALYLKSPGLAGLIGISIKGASYRLSSRICPYLSIFTFAKELIRVMTSEEMEVLTWAT